VVVLVGVVDADTVVGRVVDAVTVGVGPDRGSREREREDGGKRDPEDGPPSLPCRPRHSAGS